ncbi:MAG TPA: hypothetical protein VHU89_04230 [Acidobacteriaceae bacterium]|nr:hypothetical protein [Acidobacteriaceae bacterium]
MTAAVALSPGCLCGQALDALSQQSAENPSQKTEDWPGQVRAYTMFAGILASEDYRAQQDPDHAQRFDYHQVVGLMPDDVGDMRSTLVAADTKRRELASEFYKKYPKLTPEQEMEEAVNGPYEWRVEASAKKMQALTDLYRNQHLAIANAVNELKIQLGHDDFLRLDRFVRDTCAVNVPVHHQKAIYRTQNQ